MVKASNKEIEESKICVILMYIIFLVGLIWFLVDEKMKGNKFAKFHLKQLLILIIASVAVSIVGSIIPFIGWFIILPIGSLLVFVLWIFGLVYAIKGEEKPVPIIGQLAEKWFTF
jgi:uncharacterized membrane protein